MLRNNINTNWEFIKLPQVKFEENSDISAIDWSEAQELCLPHTWYKDGEAYDGCAAYRKNLTLEIKNTEEKENPCFYLEFEGVEQRCRVYVNGKLAGSHQGSYATFRIQIPEEASQGKEIEVEVLVDNTKTQELAPMFGDFTVFGGIYRNVNLISADKISFDYMYYGTNGVIVRSKVVDGEGILELEPHVTKDAYENAQITYELTSPDGEVVASATSKATENASIKVSAPKLWDGKDKAAIYSLKAQLQIDSKVYDETTIKTGFKTVKIDSEEGLFLNGRHYRLRGVAKHQDFGDSYNAVSTQQIDRDFELIEEIGANSVRLSHYQHPQYTYDICDKKGLLVWAEVPMLKLTRNEKLFESTCDQLRELILQNIHHPSIYCWGIQNEIAMFRDDSFMHELCHKFSDLVHELDPNRYSAGANLFSVKAKSEMNEVSDIVGYNLYFGWYYGKMPDYIDYLDNLHNTKPYVPYGISEYGVDTNIALHSEEPAVKDYSEEYQSLFHETVYRIFEDKKYLWGSYVWNMFDFSSGIRNEGGIKARNLKGLVTVDRQTRKDAFYYYKSKWSDAKTLHICSKRFEKRDRDVINIKVYTTENEATLYVNDQEVSKELNNGNATILFENVKLSNGVNNIRVTSGSLEDTCTFEKVNEAVESYKLPEQAGGPVKNWFLADDDLVKEGFLSVKNRADEILGEPEAAKVLKEFAPDLYKVMTEQDVIPLGLDLISILERGLGNMKAEEKSAAIKKINSKLNEIVDKY